MAKQRLNKKTAVSSNISLNKAKPNMPKGESHYRFSFYYLNPVGDRIQAARNLVKLIEGCKAT